VRSVRVGTADEELHREIASHIKLMEDDYRRRGMAEEQAVLAARRDFGAIEAAKERQRDERAFRWLGDLFQDMAYGCRLVRRSPGFALAVVMTVAVGVGMNAAVFSVFNAVLLRPLSYPEAQRLVWLATANDTTPVEAVRGPDFVDWRAQAPSFDAMAAYDIVDDTIDANGVATRARLTAVTEDFWKLSGAYPAIGRLPATNEMDVIVLTDASFERWFGRDASVVGQSIRLGEGQATVIGVLPRDFRFHLPWPVRPAFVPGAIEGYRVMRVQNANRRRVQLLSVVGRLKPSMTLDTAFAELHAIQSQIFTKFPSPADAQTRLRVVPLQTKLVGDTSKALAILLGAAGFLLLIACTNITNLVLVRGSNRQRELALRRVLGATVGRVVRQLTVETVMLALVGGLAGVVLAHWSLSAFLALVPIGVRRMDEAAVDSQTFALALLMSIATGLLSGVPPAARAARLDANQVMSHRTAHGMFTFRLSAGLVVAELALCVVLAVGAGLLMQSFWKLHAHPPGFHPDRILTLNVSFVGPRYRARKKRRSSDVSPGV
jgi:putative ABC transport system permease protein